MLVILVHKIWIIAIAVYVYIRAVLTIGLGGAEAPEPSKEGARDWLWGRLPSTPIAKATTLPTY